MFKGKTALVTGGSRGIGLAISKKLAIEGAAVSLLARNETILQQSLLELATDHGQTHTYHSLDLTSLLLRNPQDLNFGSPTILVNCAGVTNHSLLLRMTQEEIVNTINLNLTVPILLSQMVVKNMFRQKGSDPTILNISSVLSMTEHFIPGTSVYAASKAGLLGFTKSLSKELRGKIRINALMPGLVKETDMGNKVMADINLVLVESVANEAIRILQDTKLNGECIVLDK